MPYKEGVKLMDSIAEVDGLMRIWEHACDSARLPIELAQRDTRKIDPEMLSQLAKMISMDSYLDAYLDGVPFEDIAA